MIQKLKYTKRCKLSKNTVASKEQVKLVFSKKESSIVIEVATTKLDVSFKHVLRKQKKKDKAAFYLNQC